MPQLIAYAAVAIATTLASGTAFFAVTYYAALAVLYVGISVGLSFLANAFKTQAPAPKPEDVQQSTRQPTQPRARHYGRVKVSGPWVFAESSQGAFHKVLALGIGPFDAFEEIWIDDNLVTLNGGGLVTSEPYIKVGSAAPIIETRLGAVSNTWYNTLGSYFPEWDDTHVGNSVASIYAQQQPVKDEDFISLYPNGINTSYRVLARTSIIKNAKTGVVAYDDNAASIIRDYLTHSTGMRLPETLVNTPKAAIGWAAAFDVAAEDIPLKVGGTEKRYRLWGTYLLNERPADVLSRMLVSCDGRLSITSDGGLTLSLGKWQTPTQTIDDSCIVGVNEFGCGRDIMTTANTIKATFTYPENDYQSTEAQPWVDEEDVALRGEIPQDIQLLMSPSNGQARRLMKILAAKSNPNWTGTLVCNLKALKTFGERFIRVKYDRFGIDEDFELLDFKFEIGKDGILQNVVLQVQSVAGQAYDWNPATEEGDLPIVEVSVGNNEIPEIVNFDAIVQKKDIGGVLVPYALLSFDLPTVKSLSISLRGKATADSQWISIPWQDGSTEAESFILSDGVEYEFQASHITSTRRQGTWSNSIVLVAVSDEVAPDPVVSLNATPDVAGVTLNWNAPNSDNYKSTLIYRNTVNDFSTSVGIATIFSAPSATITYYDTRPAGSYYYWLTARNGSGIESTTETTGEVIVT